MVPVDKSYRVKILESTETQRTEPRPRAIAKADVQPTTAQILRAFKAAPGYEEIIARIPKAATTEGWDKGTQVAYFSVCNKTGAARYLDLWDCDHLDGFSDMQRSINACRAWFSHTGFASWGSPETATGRINCFFDATVAGSYSCVAQLQSYPSTARATVECLIDNHSFGPLPFTGTILQPHFSVLSAGGHHFRIRQMNGSFFFLSLTVYRF